MTTPLVAFSTSGQNSAGTPRVRQLVTRCCETPIALASAVAPPRMEIALFSAMSEAYTKSLESSNTLLETGVIKSMDNLKMDLIKRIDRILKARQWGWADLARAMDLSEQRVNNWRTRGVPAAQIRHIETALGLKRYALDDEHTEEDEVSAAISEYSWVYRHVTLEGRNFLRDMVATVKRSFLAEERRTTQLKIVKDRRTKA